MLLRSHIIWIDSITHRRWNDSPPALIVELCHPRGLLEPSIEKHKYPQQVELLPSLYLPNWFLTKLDVRAEELWGSLKHPPQSTLCKNSNDSLLFASSNPLQRNKSAASFQCLQLITQEIHQESCSLSRSRPASSTSLIKLLVSGMSSWSSPDTWQLLVAKVSLYRLNGYTLWNAPAKSSYLQQSETDWCAGIPSIQIAYDIYAYVYACNGI